MTSKGVKLQPGRRGRRLFDPQSQGSHGPHTAGATSDSRIVR